MSAPNPKIPPQDLEAEVSVLGSLLLEKDAIIKVADVLAPEDFYKPVHQKIYEAILELFGKSQPIDLLTITARLKEKNELENIGGASYLTEVIESVPSAAHVGRYAEIVREKRVRRDFVKASNEIHERVFGEENFEDLIDNIEKRVFSISQLSKPQKFVHVKEELVAAYERMERLHRGDGVLRGVPTGFTGLDNILSGLQKSDLVLLGARPSFGKTSLALDIARQAAIHGSSVGVFSLEMSREQIVDRLIASQANVPLWRLRTGRLHDELEFELVRNSLDELEKLPLFIDDTPSPNVLQLRSMARRLQIEHGLDLLVIDYLQLIQPRASIDSMVHQVTEISRGLKGLARELNVPVLALSQLSRAVDQRDVKIPRLSDLRESGCLTGDTLIMMEDGRRIPIQDIVNKKTELPVSAIALDNDYKIKPFKIIKAFSSGKKKIYKLQTRSGRAVKASGNHPFLCLDGWKKLENLKPKDEIAIPRNLPTTQRNNPLKDSELILLAHLLGDGCILPNQPYHYTNGYLENIAHVDKAASELFEIKGRLVQQKNWYHLYLPSPYHVSRKRKHPITEWFSDLDIERVKSYNKKIPNKVFQCSNQKIALFLRHLWSTDGNLSWKLLNGRRPAGNIYYASSSLTLAEQVQHLLLRLGIQSRKSSVQKANYKPTYHIHVQGASNQITFLETVGIADRRSKIIPKILEILKLTKQNPNKGAIPSKAWKILIEPAKNIAGLSWRDFSSRIDTAYCGSTLFKHGLSQERMSRVYTALAPRLEIIGTNQALETLQLLENIATSDIYWDSIESITEIGVEEVYDLTVDGAHNFIANDIIAHNSLEQDSDVVLFLYRKDRDKLEVAEEDQNMVEVIIAKHRNGPLGTVKLRFDAERVSFRNIDKVHTTVE